MRYFYSCLLLLTLLSACATQDRFYQQTNYRESGVVSQKPFHQIAAECKMNTTTHSDLWGTYDLEIPRFKACMEMNGYVYNPAAQ